MDKRGHIRFSYEHEQPALFDHAILSAARSTRSGLDDVAHAIVTTMEAKYRLLCGKLHYQFPYSLSVQHLHDKSIAAETSDDVGLTLDLLKSKGITTECYYPIKDDEDPIPLPECPLFGIERWSRIPNDMDKIIDLLKHEGPLICVMRLHKNYNECSNGVYRGDGERSYLGDDGEQNPCYHTAALVGYGDYDDEVTLRFLDNDGPRRGENGIRWVNLSAIDRIYHITVGGYNTVPQ